MKTKRITAGPTLVVLVGPSGAGKTTWAKENFTSDEIVSTDALRREFLGDHRRIDEDDVIRNEFCRRIQIRLEAGLRVVADATHLHGTERRRTAKLAQPYGANIIYVIIDRPLVTKVNHGGWRNGIFTDGKSLIVRHHETFEGIVASALGGDGGVARTVVDWRVEKPEIAYPLRREWEGHTPEQAAVFDLVQRGYEGILFVGDVHGNHHGLVEMIKLARRNKLYMIFMGDIVDYGTDTLKCADEVATLLFQGRASSVLGNHERKIYQFVTDERTDGFFAHLGGFTKNLSPGNAVTINQIKAMMPDERLKWETRFIGMCQMMPHMIRLPGYTVVHGAIGPHMLDSDEFRFSPRTAQEGFALYGQTTGEFVNGYPERKYEWVDELPPRMTVVVGHDCRQDTEPLVQTGAAGGRAIFLDTGSSKPDRGAYAHLSGMSVKITSRRKMGFILEDERFHSEDDLL